MQDHVSNHQVQSPRFLMLGDDDLVCQLVEATLGISFECEFQRVPTAEMAIRRLLDETYDLIFLGSDFPEVSYAALPANIATTYQAIPKELRFVGGVKRYAEGERLFRLLRSPEVAQLGWATPVNLVPVIFLASNSRHLNRAIISTMQPVAILVMPLHPETLISQTKRMLE
jgi:hypothetical protein